MDRALDAAGAAPANVHVRPALPAELRALPVLEHAASQRFADSPYPAIADEETTTLDEFESWSERGELFVAIGDGGTPIGYAIAHDLDDDLYLHEIDVHPDFGRRGVGRRLVEYVMAWGRERGRSRITLSTFVDVPWNAPWYSRLGFRELPASEAGPGLRAERERERAMGLPVGHRIFMAREIPQVP